MVGLVLNFCFRKLTFRHIPKNAIDPPACTRMLPRRRNGTGTGTPRTIPQQDLVVANPPLLLQLLLQQFKLLFLDKIVPQATPQHFFTVTLQVTLEFREAQITM